MASPTSADEYLDLVHKSGVVDEKRLDSYVAKLRASGKVPVEPSKLGGRMVADGILTRFQADHIAQGKWRRFTIGKYKILEQLGSGGMGSVYLCEHKLMRCMRAIKILPVAKAEDEAALGRFYREARAVAAIDHPNIVHAYDIDQDEKLHFLVMEYVDGASLQDIVKKTGPLSVLRACHYIRQSAIGLDHAHRAGLVHRDIKPGNILVSREGVVKILDMGLARFFNDEEDILTRKFDENVLGTADYLAPEQAIDSHTVDIRADIYGLGATFYYMLTGKTPFGEGTVAQKLLWHQSRNPRPIRELRPDISTGVEAIIQKMMAKDPADRYAVPGDVAEALAPFAQDEIGRPPEEEMPKLSPAASGRATTDANEPAAITAISRPETPKALKGMGGSGAGAKPPSTATAVSSPATSSRPAPPAPSPLAPSAPAVSGKVATTPVVSRPTSPPPTRATVPSNASAPAPGLEPRVGAPVKSAPSLPAPAVASTAVSPRPSAAATAPVAEPEPEVDFEWQGLAGDTQETAGRGDTAPNKPGQPAARPLEKGEQQALAREKGVNRLVIAMMLGSAFLVVVVGGLIWAGWFVYTTWISPTVTGPAARKNLVVSAQNAGKSGVYKSLKTALQFAQKDDIIEIDDELITENVRHEFNPARSTEVTIQAAPGKNVVWRSASKDPKDPILHLSSASFFKLKGDRITFDGDLGDKGKVQDLILIVSSSQGLTIEDAQFKDYGRSAISVLNAVGDINNPIRLVNLTALTPPADKDGSMFNIDALEKMRHAQVDYIEIKDVRAPGLTKAQVLREANGAVGPNYHVFELPAGK